MKVDQWKKLFDNFYNLASFHLQSAYLFGQVNVIKKIRVYTEREHSRRNMTRIYYLPDTGKSLQGVFQASSANFRRQIVKCFREKVRVDSP